MNYKHFDFIVEDVGEHTAIQLLEAIHEFCEKNDMKFIKGGHTNTDNKAILRKDYEKGNINKKFLWV